jgi:hypothetical protein
MHPPLSQSILSADDDDDDDNGGRRCLNEIAASRLAADT